VIKNKLSVDLLSIVTPYFCEFVQDKYKVYSYLGSLDGERYIIGEHIENGLCVCHCYNRTAVPFFLSEERVSRLLGREVLSFSEDVYVSLCEELVKSGYREISREGVTTARDLLDLIKRRCDENYS
jgi:hypothetical protein